MPHEERQPVPISNVFVVIGDINLTRLDEVIVMLNHPPIFIAEVDRLDIIKEILFGVVYLTNMITIRVHNLHLLMIHKQPK